jgi:hypothetical protein
MSARITASLFGIALALTISTAGVEEDRKNSTITILPGCRAVFEDRDLGRQELPELLELEAQGLVESTLG